MEPPKYQGGNEMESWKRGGGFWGKLATGLGIAGVVTTVCVIGGVIGVIVIANLVWSSLQDTAAKFPGGSKYEASQAEDRRIESEMKAIADRVGPGAKWEIVKSESTGWSTQLDRMWNTHSEYAEGDMERYASGLGLKYEDECIRNPMIRENGLVCLIKGEVDGYDAQLLLTDRGPGDNKVKIRVVLDGEGFKQFVSDDLQKADPELEQRNLGEMQHIADKLTKQDGWTVETPSIARRGGAGCETDTGPCSYLERRWNTHGKSLLSLEQYAAQLGLSGVSILECGPGGSSTCFAEGTSGEYLVRVKLYQTSIGDGNVRLILSVEKGGLESEWEEPGPVPTPTETAKITAPVAPVKKDHLPLMNESADDLIVVDGWEAEEPGIPAQEVSECRAPGTETCSYMERRWNTHNASILTMADYGLRQLQISVTKALPCEPTPEGGVQTECFIEGHTSDYFIRFSMEPDPAGGPEARAKLTVERDAALIEQNRIHKY